MLADPNLDKMIDAFEDGRSGGRSMRGGPALWSSKIEGRALRDAWQDGRSFAWADRFMPAKSHRLTT